MKIDLRHIILYVLGAVLISALIGFTGKSQESQRISELFIDISFEDGNYFIDQGEVAALVNADNTDYVLGTTRGVLDLKELETRIEKNAFVRDAQVFSDIKGNLQVRVTQAKPIARIMRQGAEDYYVDEQGVLLPLNAQHTARVLLIEMKNVEWEGSLNENEQGQQLLALLRYIESDPFWKAQIAHLFIEPSGEVRMLSQVSKQEIIFGNMTEYHMKFKKLKVFYEEILPNKGWNTYDFVNVKFENQIVCK